MALLTAQVVTRSGLLLGEVAASSGGDNFTNTGSEFLRVRNASGGSTTVTIVTTATVDGLAVADRAVVVGDGEAKYIGPFKRNEYGTTVSFTYSAYAGVMVALLKVTPETV